MKVYVEKVSQSPTTPVQTVDYLISFTEMDKKGSYLSDVKLLKELERRVIEILKETRPELFESKKMNDINNQFLIELKDLLKKYNADISIEEYINGYPEIAIYGCKDGEYFTINRKYFDGELLGYRIIST